MVAENNIWPWMMDSGQLPTMMTLINVTVVSAATTTTRMMISIVNNVVLVASN